MKFIYIYIFCFILCLLINENGKVFKRSKILNNDVNANDIIFPIISPDDIFFIPKIIELSEFEDDFRRLCSVIVLYFFSLLNQTNIN